MVHHQASPLLENHPLLAARSVLPEGTPAVRLFNPRGLQISHTDLRVAVQPGRVCHFWMLIFLMS